jgi:hypothetical protein
MARPAKKAASTKATDTTAKVATTLHLTTENHKLLKLASIDLGKDMSEIVNAMIRENFAGWHIRRGRGEVAQATAPETTVTIPTATERIDAIGRRATLPVDSAIDQLTPDQN